MFLWHRIVNCCDDYVWLKKDAQIFQKSTRHLKIVGARSVAWSKFPAEDSQILGATTPWHQVFVHLSFGKYQCMEGIGS